MKSFLPYPQDSLQAPDSDELFGVRKGIEIYVAPGKYLRECEIKSEVDISCIAAIRGFAIESECPKKLETQQRLERLQSHPPLQWLPVHCPLTDLTLLLAASIADVVKALRS